LEAAEGVEFGGRVEDHLQTDEHGAVGAGQVHDALVTGVLERAARIVESYCVSNVRGATDQVFPRDVAVDNADVGEFVAEGIVDGIIPVAVVADGRDDELDVLRGEIEDNAGVEGVDVGGEDAAIVWGSKVTLVEEFIDGGVPEDCSGEVCQEC
jgi:hypothetical protein